MAPITLLPPPAQAAPAAALQPGFSCPLSPLRFAASRGRGLRLVEGEWAGLPRMDWHKGDLNVNGCAVLPRWTKKQTVRFPLDARRLVAFRTMSACHRGERLEHARSLYSLEEGSQFKVSLERSIISCADSATVSPWYVKHFGRKRENKTIKSASLFRSVWLNFNDSGQVQKDNKAARWGRFFSVITSFFRQPGRDWGGGGGRPPLPFNS